MNSPFVALVVAVAVLTGCARAGQVSPGGPGPESPVTSTPGPATPEPGPTALAVSPRPGLVDVRPHIWDRAEPVGSRKLRIEFYGGVEECEGLDRVEVDETQNRVTISLFTGRVPTADVCIEIAVLKSVLVRVDAPIGDRDVVDGNAGI